MQERKNITDTLTSNKYRREFEEVEKKQEIKQVQ